MACRRSECGRTPDPIASVGVDKHDVVVVHIGHPRLLQLVEVPPRSRDIPRHCHHLALHPTPHGFDQHPLIIHTTNDPSPTPETAMDSQEDQPGPAAPAPQAPLSADHQGPPAERKAKGSGVSHEGGGTRKAKGTVVSHEGGGTHKAKAVSSATKAVETHKAKGSVFVSSPAACL